MDRELPDNEAADVERHVRDCSECREHVDVYEEVSHAFVAYCDAALGARIRRKLPYWLPVLSSAAAAALLLLVFQPASVKPIPVRPRVADSSPAAAIGTTPRPVKKVHRRHTIGTMKTPNANWVSFEPAIQIAIPVEAMFPPGAVPQGITFLANLSIAADDAVPALRLHQSFALPSN